MVFSLSGLRSIAITDAGVLGCALQNTYTFSAKGPSAVRLQPAEKKPRKFLFTISNTLEKGLNSHTTVYHCDALTYGKKKIKHLLGVLSQTRKMPMIFCGPVSPIIYSSR